MYTEKIQDIYQRNMSNLIRKQIVATKFGQKQKELFPVSLDNEGSKVDSNDVEMLERYEQLLLNQNKLLIMKIQAGGAQTL